MPITQPHPSLTQVLRQAADHVDSGRLQQGEALLRQVLATQPDNHEALNLLGVVALQAGHVPQAADLFARAIHLHDADAQYHCNLGVALLSANRPNEGEDALLAALRLKPSHPVANLNLGLRDLQAGRFEDARARLEKAVKKMPRHPTALNALGVAHSKCGYPAKALSYFRSVLKIQPGHFDAQLNMAGALTELKKPDEAIALYRRLIESHPDQARLYFNLGVALRLSQNVIAAIEAYEQALALEPRLVDAHVNASVLYSNMGDDEAALEHAKLAGQLRTNDVHIMLNEARMLFNAGLGDDAQAACERISAQFPDNTEALGIRIRALQNDGHFERARDLGAQALMTDPNATFALAALSFDKNYTFSDENIERLKRFASSNESEPSLAIQAWFALGKIHHDRKDFERAFEFYKRGNAMRDAEFTWTDEDEDTLFTAQIKTCTEAFFKTAPAGGNDSERPVFIVGMPRSGTTLVEQIIASHADAAGAGELPTMHNISTALPHALGDAEPYPSCLTKLDAALTDRFARQYLDRLDRVSTTARRVTDKMPDNYLRLGLIQRLFPKARIIHCQRDPMATCFSIYQQNFKGFHPYAYDLTKLGRRYRNHERLMEHWRQVLPLPILDVAYEDLVQNQEEQSRRILAFCNLDWDEGVLNFHKTTRTVQTASLWQVRQPIYAGSLKSWRAYEAALEPLKIALKNG